MVGVGLEVSGGFLIIPSCDFPYMRVDSHWPALTGLGLIIYFNGRYTSVGTRRSLQCRALSCIGGTSRIRRVLSDNQSMLIWVAWPGVQARGLVGLRAWARAQAQA